MNQKCKCACHDNVLTKPYDHDTQCCDDMNGFLVISESEANKILSAPSIEEKIQDFIFRFGHGGTNQEGVFEPHENTKRASIWLRTAFQDIYSLGVTDGKKFTASYRLGFQLGEKAGVEKMRKFLIGHKRSNTYEDGTERAVFDTTMDEVIELSALHSKK